MPHRPALPVSAPQPNPVPTPTPIPTTLLDTPRRRVFAQRLAVLIERIRAANPEGAADEC